MDGRKIKAMFFDIDGTLIGYRTHQIHPRDLESLRKLKEKGIKLFIATGRDLLIPIEAQTVENILPLMDGVVNANGQRCYLTDGTEVSYHPLPEEDFRPIRKNCEENHIAILYYIGHDSYVTELTDHVLGFEKHVGIPHPPIRPIAEDLGSPQKICLYASPEDEARFIRPLLKLSTSARNTEHLIDLIPDGIGKDSGIREFCAYFGIRREETMAFGDGENDLSMMTEAGISVAMAIADERVKTAADYVTLSSEEAGITRALEHFGLL